MYRLIYGVVILIALPTLVLAQATHSPYVGRGKGALKTLFEEEIQALLNSQGMGLAKAAGLNHYPGLRHVLDLATPLQLSETQQIYDRVHQEAVRLGTLIVDKEQELD